MKLHSVFHVSVSEYILSRSDRIMPISAAYRLSTFTCLNFSKKFSWKLQDYTARHWKSTDCLFTYFLQRQTLPTICLGGLTVGEIDLINCVLYACYSRCSRRNFGVACFGCCGKPVSVSLDGVVVKVVFWKNTVKVFFLVGWAVCRVAH